MSQLRHIHQWFLDQRLYRVRCSSVLVVYDAAAIATKQDSHPAGGVVQDASVTSEAQDTEGNTQPHNTSEPQSAAGTTQPLGNLPLISTKPQTLVSWSGDENTQPSCSQTQGNTFTDTDKVVVKTDTENVSEKFCDDSILVKVKMIDFAHMLYAFGERDDNYIFGLEKLIEFFSTMTESEKA